MPSDKHTLRMARARDLDFFTNQRHFVPGCAFSPIAAAKCLHHGATFVPLWSPILSSQPRKVTICGRHVMASVRDIQIAEALLFHVSRCGGHVSGAYSLYFP